MFSAFLVPVTLWLVYTYLIMMEMTSCCLTSKFRFMEKLPPLPIFVAVEVGVTAA